MSQKICPNCNTPLNADAPFCPNCGAPVQAAPAAQPVVTAKVAGRGLVIAALVLGILAVVFGGSALITIADEISEVKELGTEALKLLGFGDYLMEEYMGSIVVAAALSVLAIVFGAKGRKSAYKPQMGKSGFTLGIIGAALTVASFIMCVPYL